jgi:hypothetical protein
MSKRSTVIALLSFVLSAATLLAQTSTYGQNQPYSQSNGQYGQNASGNTIPDGTRFLIRLNDTLDTAKLKPGKKFEGKLSEDLTAPDGSTIAAGTKVKGHVSSVDRGMSARLLLSFDEIQTRRGWRPLIATVTGVPGEHAVKQETGPEGEIQKTDVNKMRVMEGAVIGAAVGAAAGAAAGGGHGAAIGAAAGGALGGGAGILTNRDLKLQKGSELEVRLDRPIAVPR